MKMASIVDDMCGRFALSRLPAEIIAEFEITAGLTGAILPADWNISPTKDIYIIRDFLDNEKQRKRELTNVSWGLIAGWSKNSAEALRSQSQAINARTETVQQKPTFRSAFRSRRCLIPADGYYEWATQIGPFPSQQPFYISSSTPVHPILAFAGIWDQWIDSNGEIHQSAALITRPAVDFLAEVHSRMPTFLPRSRWEDWLLPAPVDVDHLKALLEINEPVKDLKVFPVSKQVNSAKNNGSDLIREIELIEMDTLF
jgi:putative SOS response-associated peptidase YedK